MYDNYIGENRQEEDKQVPKWHDALTKVTPFSRYLALILFIALPILGFWLGGTYERLAVGSISRQVSKDVVNDIAIEADSESAVSDLLEALRFTIVATSTNNGDTVSVICAEYPEYGDTNYEDPCYVLSETEDGRIQSALLPLLRESDLGDERSIEIIEYTPKYVRIARVEWINYPGGATLSVQYLYDNEQNSVKQLIYCASDCQKIDDDTFLVAFDEALYRATYGMVTDVYDTTFPGFNQKSYINSVPMNSHLIIP